VADNHSFDIVSEINTAEMHNAVVQAQHEIAVRYDFKGTHAAIDYNKKENKLTLLADHKGQLDTVIQVLKEKMARRGVPANALLRGKLEEASHDTVREVLSLHVGIDSDDAKKMVKQIKQLGLKVQARSWTTRSASSARRSTTCKRSSPTSRSTVRNIRYNS
jgi:uncharacterized protein YajQ (UPF0234 family)